MRLFDRGTLSSVNDGRYQLWWALFWISFFLLTYLSRTIIDFDFFWHLKTGEWIWQHRMLPDHDPFTLTPTPTLSVKQQFILTSYWLSQLLYYGLVQIAGWWGIALLRVVLASALVFFIYGRCEKKVWSPKIMLVIAGFIILSSYPLERPQIFSFVGFAALLYILHRFRVAGREPGLSSSVLGLSILMLLWGNMHGGVLLGQVTLIVYLGFLIVDRYLLKSALPRQRFFIEASACIASVLFSLVNPNGLRFLDIFITTAAGNELFKFNQEYRTFFNMFFEKTHLAPTVIFLILFVAFLVRGVERKDLFQVFICIGTGIMGFYQIRYLPFFIIAVLPFAAKAVERFPRNTIAKGALVLAIAYQFIVFAPMEYKNIANLRNYGFVFENNFTPVSAVNFILDNKLEGNLLNEYNWGGYLIYRLGPERKVFVDGRTLYDRSLWEWGIVSGGIAVEKNQREKTFYDLVKKYDFKYVLVAKYAGYSVSMIADDMTKRKEWKVIYHDRSSILFARQDD